MQLFWSVAWLFFYAMSSFFIFRASSETPYDGAQNYWPLTRRTGLTVTDVISGAKGNVHNAGFIKNIGIYGAVSFSGNMQWIDFPTGQFKSVCIENPESCMYGFTIAFWIRFMDGKYILATGAYTNSSQGTGIRMIYDKRKYIVTVRTKVDVWRVSARAHIKTWCHVVIRWTSQQGLQLFLNGKSAASDDKGKSQQIPSTRFSQTLSIARPPRFTQKGYGIFDLAHLAIWLDHLTDPQISQLGDLVLDTGRWKYQCAAKNISCTNSPCGSACQLDYPDAVCLEVKHVFCKEILKELSTVRSTSMPWSNQSASSSIDYLTKDVKFTPTASPTKRTSRNDHTPIKHRGPRTLPPSLGYELDYIYSHAIHYISVRGDKLVDLRGNSKVSMPETPRILSTTQLREVVELNGRHDCITLKDIKFRCIRNPSLCQNTGFTVALWLRNHDNKQQNIVYAIQDHRGSGTGFMIHHGERGINFTVKVRTRRLQWEAIIHKMPYHSKWWHLLITWNKRSGIALYINGNFAIQRGYAEDITRDKTGMDSSLATKADEIVIGCSNRTTSLVASLKEFGRFDFGSLAIWDRVLSQPDIERAYKVSLIETKESATCCKQLSGHDCIALPCHKFKDPAKCDSLFGNDNCLCKERMQPDEKCQDGTPLKHCGNSGKYQCDRLASQTGYCNYYQAEMEKHCPVSCNLCDGLYRKAAHYFKLRSNQLLDGFSSSSLEVFPFKLKTEKTKQLGDVISLKNQNFYVNIKGLRRECATDPNVCSSGLSVAFWLYLVNGRYIITGGSYRDEPRASGFIVLHDSNSSQLRIEVATLRQKWTALLHKIPFIKQWFHLVFTWSVTTGLRISVNGQFLLQDAGAEERNYHPKSRHEPNGILIGDKDPSNGSTEDIDFKIGHLVIWNKALDSWDIQLAYKESIEKNTFSSTCCSELSANKCVSNVCYKFREPEFCKKFFNRQKCLCPETRVREKCNTHVFKGECKDRRKDCKALAAQNGYCDYYQQEMEMLCPLSCKFCNGLYSKVAHYFKLRSNQLIDEFSSSSLEVFPLKLKTKRTKQLGDVISLKNQNFYVNIKGLRRECATDPNVCSSGLSVAFWLYLVNGRYIITGGSYRDEPRASGFIVLHDSNSSQLRIEVATLRHKWTALLHKIPFIKQWFHLVFTWSVTTGLRISVNGQFLLQDAGAEERNYHPKSPHEPNGILIGDKDPSNGSTEDIDFKIGHLVIWNKALDSWDIQLAYKESIEKNTFSSTCCSELSANKCVSNVCYKFRAPEFCKQFFNRQKCLCPETRVREKCNTHVFKGECKDRRKDCKALAAQNGYCDYYQQEMEMLCPLSCKSCVLPRNKADGRKGAKMSKEVLVFALIGCAAGIILLFLISLYSWKVYRRKKWMKWSTYFVTVIPRDQSDGRLHGKDELEQ